MTPMNLTTPKLINNSEKIKKGRSEGKTIVHQIFSPPLEASNDSWGKMIKPTAIIVTEVANSTVLDFDFSKIQPPLEGYKIRAVRFVYNKYERLFLKK
jgi:hypothetical protein